MPDTAYTAVTWTAGDVITEAKLDSMVANDRAYDAHSDGLLLTERTAPSTPSANNIHLYAKDNSGTSALYFKDDAGDETEIGTQRDLGVKYADDYADLATAVADLSAGDTLILGNSVYELTDTLTISVSDVTIVGQNASANASNGSIIQSNFSTSKANGIHLAASGICLRNLAFQVKSGTTRPSYSITIERNTLFCRVINCLIDAATGTAIGIGYTGTSYAYHVQVLGNVFKNVSQGIAFEYAQRCMANSNQFNTVSTRDYNFTANSSRCMFNDNMIDLGGLNDGSNNTHADNVAY